ncbi:MAG: ABC transporter ATP-binding protein [Acidimicrobiia bacterium]|nr:ABC transporter ATP-binding protein [Acidimicrobiia bacterium]MDQ3500908.1 ABC transporter ATP-binding protein [Actinomycetota bacterium]
MLEIADLDAGYGLGQVLFGVDLTVAPGEIVGLLGRNGMGKTTTVRTIFGLLAPMSGTIRFRGKDLVRQRPHRIARAGLGLVPEGRQIFPLLSVDQTLTAMARPGPDGRLRWTRDRVYELFPLLAERRSNRGDVLSGGEQQMLAIGRALVTNPDLLVLDEATEGLAPIVRSEIWKALDNLRGEGESMLVIDQNIGELLVLADRAAILEKGRIVWSGTAGELQRNPGLQQTHLSVG